MKNILSEKENAEKKAAEDKAAAAKKEAAQAPPPAAADSGDKKEASSTADFVPDPEAFVVNDKESITSAFWAYTLVLLSIGCSLGLYICRRVKKLPETQPLIYHSSKSYAKRNVVVMQDEEGL